jgi:hypothetical protein
LPLSSAVRLASPSRTNFLEREIFKDPSPISQGLTALVSGKPRVIGSLFFRTLSFFAQLFHYRYEHIFKRIRFFAGPGDLNTFRL